MDSGGPGTPSAFGGFGGDDDSSGGFSLLSLSKTATAEKKSRIIIAASR